MNDSIKRAAIIVCVLIFRATTSFSQLTITGPSCVLPGLEYQYLVSGNFVSSDNTKWCIEGGVIQGGDSNCKTGQDRYIRVVWNDNASKLSLQVASQQASLAVKASKPLDPGYIDAASKLKEKKKNQALAPLYCSNPTGGSCSANYVFQWEESKDGMTWQSVIGAVEGNLKFSSDLTQTMYYRRRVKDTVSLSEAISDVAVVVVKTTKK